MAAAGMLAAAALALLAGCADPPPAAATAAPVAAVPFARTSAYLWQRAWNPAVRDAVAAPGPVRELRVLALEVDDAGHLRRTPVDLAALAAGPAGAVPVVRIDGRRPPIEPAALRAALDRLRADWQAAGIATPLVELDHDCATARLDAWRRWIGALRAGWPGAPAIAITGLPDWLRAQALPALLAAVDGFTLQVHAVGDPGGGLFDADRAAAHVARLDALAVRPYDVALPTYGARLRGALQWADPGAVAALLRRWDTAPPRQLRAVRFFRLPVAGDRNTWSAATLAAVIAGQPPTPRLRLHAVADPSGAIDLVLGNPGPFDAALPAALALPADCTGDAASGFRLGHGPGGVALFATEADRLAPGTRRLLGWVRCATPPDLAALARPGLEVIGTPAADVPLR